MLIKILFQSSDDDDNESVVKSRVSVKDAANRFKSSIVDSTDIGTDSSIVLYFPFKN